MIWAYTVYVSLAFWFSKLPPKWPVKLCLQLCMDFLVQRFKLFSVVPAKVQQQHHFPVLVFCIDYFPCFSDKIFDQSNLSKERVIWAFVGKPTLVRNDGSSVSLLVTLNLNQETRSDKRSYTVHLLLFILSGILSHGLVLATFRVGPPTLFN